MKLCCKSMDNVSIRKILPQLYYDPCDRSYYIESENKKSVYVIEYCPWCGTKLPTYLGGVMVDYILEAGYEGFDDPNLPEEFKTDEWWKKRGL